MIRLPLLCLFLLLPLALLEAQVVYQNAVPGAAISEGTAIGGQDQVKNPNGQVIAEPFADAVDIEVLEDGSALVTDRAMGFIVGFGGGFGQQFVPFGQVPGADQLFRASDGELYVTGAEGNVWRVDVQNRQAGYICGGVANPTDVRQGVRQGGSQTRVHLVEDATAGTVTVADATTGAVLATETGLLSDVIAAEGYQLAADDPLRTTTDSEADPEAAIANTDNDSWWWFLLVPFLAAFPWGMARGLQAVKNFKQSLPPTPQYDAAKDPYGGSVDMVPPDPCEELRKKLEAARAQEAADAEASAVATAESEAATTAATETAQAAEAADKAAAAAQAALKDAEEELSAANQESVEGDSAESDDYKFTSRDKTLRDRAVGESEAAWKAGGISAAEHEARVQHLNTKEGTDELRAEDDKNRAKRQAEAQAAHEAAETEVAATEQAAVDAKAAAAAATTAAEAAKQAAAEAGQAAAASAAAAQTAQAAYDECMKTSRAAWAEQEAERKKEHDEAIERQNNPEPIQEGTAEELLGGGSSQPRSCCENGVWIGIGYGGGGTFFIGGKEYAHMLWFCSCDPSIYVEVVIETWRAGPGLGGEGTVHVGMIVGAPHASAVPGLLAGDANGVGWDLSLGGSAKQAASAASETGSALKNLAKAVKTAQAAGDKNAPLSAVAKNENVAKAMKSLAGTAQNTVVKTAAGAAQSGSVAKISVGPAMQVGVWYGFGSSVHVNSFNSCGCSVKNH